MQSVDEFKAELKPGQTWSWLMGGTAVIKSVGTTFAVVSVSWPPRDGRPGNGFTGRRSFKKLRQLVQAKLSDSVC